MAETLAREGSSAPPKGTPAQRVHIEGADKNKEKAVTYGNGGSEPNGM